MLSEVSIFSPCHIYRERVNSKIENTGDLSIFSDPIQNLISARSALLDAAYLVALLYWHIWNCVFWSESWKTLHCAILHCIVNMYVYLENLDKMGINSCKICKVCTLGGRISRGLAVYEIDLFCSWSWKNTPLCYTALHCKWLYNCRIVVIVVPACSKSTSAPRSLLFVFFF